MLRVLLTSALLGLSSPVLADPVMTGAGPMTITPVATGLREPWSLAFLPDGRFLVTERAGRLLLFTADGGQRRSLGGLPKVAAIGQGGLLDVLIPRDFATSREVWLSFSQPQGAGKAAGTAVGKATLSADQTRLDDFTTLYAVAKGGNGGNHFGGRLVEGRDGTIYLTTGDRGAAVNSANPAQDPQRGEGKVIALTRQGAPATIQPGMAPGIVSMGHRNPQGAALDADGNLWVSEHGAQGGDELNAVRAGANYGWPIIAYGKNYDDTPIGEGRTKPGMEQPVLYWDPSIAPSGLLIHSGKLIPAWKGDIFTGSLKFDYIAHLDAANGLAEERLSSRETGRVRDVREAPDGAIWFLSVTNGAAYRLAP